MCWPSGALPCPPALRGHPPDPPGCVSIWVATRSRVVVGGVASMGWRARYARDVRVRYVCTSCDGVVSSGADVCPRCGDKGVIAKECAACGERVRLNASICLYCDAVQSDQPEAALAAIVRRAEEL